MIRQLAVGSWQLAVGSWQLPVASCRTFPQCVAHDFYFRFLPPLLAPTSHDDGE